MRISSDEAFLLEVGNLSDTDRLVVFFARHGGTRRGAARGARRRYSRFAGQLQLLAKVQVTWAEKEGRELVRVRSVELVRAADRLQEDLEGILLSCYLAEQVQVLAPEHEVNDPFYRLLDSTLEQLTAGCDRDLAARYFEVWALRLSGVFPAPRECPECGRSLAAGAVLPKVGETLVCRECGGPGGSAELSPAEVEGLLEVHCRSLADLVAAPGPTAPHLRTIEGLCARVRRRFLQAELKSYDVMKRTLAGV